MERIEASCRLRLPSIRWTIALVAMLAVAVPALADWDLRWWTVDGGGEIQAMGGDWELSSSLGQWDATAHTRSSGGAWELTGGFWSLGVEDTDYLFKDSYE